MKRFIFSLVLIPILVACQKSDFDNDGIGETMESKGTQTVKAADGTLYAISCLRNNAAQIERDGTSALAQCKMDPKTGEGRNFHRGGTYYVYWPPSYYSPSYNYNYYPSSTSYTYTYPQSSKTFCGFVFGSGTGINCYKILGYNNTSYTSYYNTSCSSCMYAYYPGQCQNTCWSNYYWY